MAEPAPAQLLAGFDAGQTHTTCRLALAAGGPPLAEGQGPGVCHLAAPEGAARFRAALAESLAAARAALPPDRGVSAEGPAQAVSFQGPNPAAIPLAAAAVGASGIEAGTAVQEQGLALAAEALQLPPGRLWVSGDERTALQGAFAGGAGIVVISGTGTIAVGADGRGRQHRCAGWGWLLDGAGSAMDIGRDGLALSLRMADGRHPLGPLRDALWQSLALEPHDPAAPQRLKALVVTPEFGPAGFARLAPLVARLAEEGDGDAARILEDNARALAAMAATVARRLALEGAPVCAMGGALMHLQGLRQRLAAALAEQLPGSRLVPPLGDACQGALQLAAQQLPALRDG